MEVINEIRLRNLLLEKEFTIARANRELSEAGKWLIGWDGYIEGLNKQIDKILSEEIKINKNLNVNWDFPFISDKEIEQKLEEIKKDILEGMFNAK